MNTYKSVIVQTTMPGIGYPTFSPFQTSYGLVPPFYKAHDLRLIASVGAYHAVFSSRR